MPGSLYSRWTDTPLSKLKCLRVGALDVGSRAVGVLATAVVKELSKSARVDRPTTRDGCLDGCLDAFQRSFLHEL